MLSFGMGGLPGSIHDLIHNVRWSGDELRLETLRRTRILADLFVDGIGDNRRFVIAHANSPSFFADLFAVWELGGCAICVNSGLSASELQNVVRFTDPLAVLVNESHETSLDIPTLNTAELPDPSKVTELPSVSLDDPALILFTSGTSGDPKGVVHTFRSLFARISLNQAQIDREDLTRTLCTLPTHFGHGLIGNCLTPLLAGCEIFLMHGGGVAQTAQLGTVIDEHKITFMSSVPGVWKLALRVSSRPTLGSIRRIHIGSAPLSAELWREVVEWSGAREVVNMYGITETANWIGGASSALYQPEDGLLGTLWGGTAAVRCDDGSVNRHGAGEILLRVPSVMSAYYQRPDLTADVLNHGWFSTGDTGVIDDVGVIRLTGRNRYAINRDGIKIYPEELDFLFERHEDVSEACAFGLDDQISGQCVAAAISLREGAQVNASELIAWARTKIRPEAVPQRLFILDEIPKTDRGKLNRDNVAKACIDGGTS